MINSVAAPVETQSLEEIEPELTQALRRDKKTLGWQTYFSDRRKAGGHPNYCCKRITCKSASTAAVLVLTILTILTILIIVLVVWRGRESNQMCPDVNCSAVWGPACPAGWIGYEGKCYFFSEEERNWTSAQSFCVSQGSSLAVIQSELERVFMLRFKGKADHWIGLQKDLNGTWIWADGTEYDNTLMVKGIENCAYLSVEYVIASRCHAPIKWICNRPDEYMKNKNSTAG